MWLTLYPTAHNQILKTLRTRAHTIYISFTHPRKLKAAQHGQLEESCVKYLCPERNQNDQVLSTQWKGRAKFCEEKL